MVKFITALKPLINFLMKMAGVNLHCHELLGSFENLYNPKNHKTIPTSETNINYTRLNKTVVVLIHGFPGEGIVAWLFQIGYLTKHYSCQTKQTECLMEGLKKLGVEALLRLRWLSCILVLLKALVVLGSVLAMTDFICEAILQSLGVGSLSDMLLPTSVDELKAPSSVGAYKKLWFPHRLYTDYLELCFLQSFLPIL